MSVLPRLTQPLLTELVADSRVVVVNGPRQAGKSTLLRQFQAERGGELRTLDDPLTRQAARSDPVGFVTTTAARPLIIDEVQLGGNELVRAVKLVVDADNSRGQFILSGSTRFLTVPTLSESLAGRAVFQELWPFAVAERVGSSGDVLERAFADPTGLLSDSPSTWGRDDYLAVICTGGFPEAVARRTARSRLAWFDGYLDTVLSRDISEFAQIHRLRSLPQLLGLIAARAGGGLVGSDLARAADLSASTLRNYRSYLETVFLTLDAPAWLTNRSSRLTKTPKSYLTDSGLAAAVQGLSPEALRPPGHPALGGLVETFVFAELHRLRSVSETPFTVSHLRDRDGREVDFVLERRDGRILAIEVKASMSPSSPDIRHLRKLAEQLGDQFAGGLLLHLGSQSIPLADRIVALPLSALWDHRPLDPRPTG